MKIALIVIGAFVGILTANVIILRKMFWNYVKGHQKIDEMILDMIVKINEDVFYEVFNRDDVHVEERK